MARWRALALEGQPAADGFTRLQGVVHVHTTASDGGGTPEQVIAAAQRAGLDFLAITDHNNLDAKAFEGRHGGVLVMVGTEVSTTAGHVLALGLDDPAFRFSGDVSDAFEDVRDLGGVAFAAHPMSPRPDLRFAGWNEPGPWGMELINGDSQWREAGWGRLLWTGLLYPFNPRYALLSSVGHPASVLERWDVLLAQRDVAGLSGADAHSRLPLWKRTALRFPSYEAVFELSRNHVLLEQPLTGDTSRDARRIVEALARGRSYLALDALADGGGFFFVVEGADGRWTMGDTAPAGPALRLRAGGRLPRGARISVLHDGRPLPVEQTGQGQVELPSLGPGVYRVEVRAPRWSVPWLLSNPIYVFDPARAAERARRAAWPTEPVAPPQPAVVLDAFEGSPAFAAEFDASSSMNAVVAEAGAGPDGSTAGRLAFRLGAPRPGRPYTWCALVSRHARDLSGRQGLVLWLRGNGVYRMWVQVRDENPASADEGTEWWFASLRTSQEWRRVTLPFARLRSINPKTDGRLDLDKVRQLVFVVDAGAVKPGTEGTIWIDDVGVY